MSKKRNTTGVRTCFENPFRSSSFVVASKQNSFRNRVTKNPSTTSNTAITRFQPIDFPPNALHDILIQSNSDSGFAHLLKPIRPSSSNVSQRQQTHATRRVAKVNRGDPGTITAMPKTDVIRSAFASRAHVSCFIRTALLLTAVAVSHIGFLGENTRSVPGFSACKLVLSCKAPVGS